MWILIKTDHLIGPIFIALLGILPSLWTNCIFIFTLTKDNADHDYNKGLSDLIFKTIQQEYFVICLLGIIGLIWGLAKKNKRYLYPWCCLKICEICAIIIGTITIYPSYPEMTGIIPLGVGAVFQNVWLLYCVYRSYVRMLIPLPPKHLKKTDNEQKEPDDTKDIKIQVEEEKFLNKKSFDDDTKPLKPLDKESFVEEEKAFDKATEARTV